MQQSINMEDEVAPQGVTLRDLDDFGTLRTQIFDGVKNAMVKSFPVVHGNTRIELHDVDYEDVNEVPISEQKKTLLSNKYITKKLKGTVKLLDNTTDEVLEEKRLSLMRVPYLTNRGTFIHGGNEYASIMQSRLLPGVYTRRQANGELETQFNVRPGTGKGFRVGFEPETTQYRVKMSQANLHLYSLLKDLGHDDKDLELAWGPEIFAANKAKYDARVFDKAYEKLVAPRLKKDVSSREDKVRLVQAALDAAQIHTRVAKKNLPNMFDAKVAAEWNARWAGKQAMLKVAGVQAVEDKNLNSLIAAKAHSDKKEYGAKQRIMALLMHDNPQEFIVDSPGTMSGVTHIPTGFKIHVPRNIIPASVRHVFAAQEEADDDYTEDENIVDYKKASEELGAVIDDAASGFTADFTPDDIRDAYNAIYGHYGPRLASMAEWPSSWINKDVDDMGWLQWYEQYNAGRRTDDDARQIKRWKSFKARHGAQFVNNPTPRRAFALRNWAIDPLKLIADDTQRSKLEQEMEAYKQKAWDTYNTDK